MHVGLEVTSEVSYVPWWILDHAFFIYIYPHPVHTCMQTKLFIQWIFQTWIGHSSLTFSFPIQNIVFLPRIIVVFPHKSWHAAILSTYLQPKSKTFCCIILQYSVEIPMTTSKPFQLDKLGGVNTWNGSDSEHQVRGLRIIHPWSS